MSSRLLEEELPRRRPGGVPAAAPRLRAVASAEGAVRRARASPPGTAPTVGPRPAPPPRAAELAGAALVLAAPFLLWAYFLAATAAGAVR